LGVKHVVLCGHTACGGAKAALGGSKVGGVLDTWLTPLRQMCRSQAKEIEAAGDEDARAVKLAELNVKRGVDILMDHMVIQEHIEKRGLQVHGVIFDLESGKLRDLGIGNGKKMGTDDGGLEGSLVRGKHGVLHFEDDGAVMKAAAKTEL
jgi:carbonic anhydrase